MAHRVLALVPARSGSKGLPGKNCRLLAGRPLLAHAVEAAVKSGVVDRVVLSTDSPEIAEIGRQSGAEVPFLRPADLAADTTPMLPVVTHAVETLSASGWAADIVVLLQPTAPLRRPEHVAMAVTLLHTTGADSVATVIPLPLEMSPDCLMRIDDGRLVPFMDRPVVTRRQDARPAYKRDGTVYTFWTRTLLGQRSLYGADCRPLVIPASESVTIDTPDDWAEAERRLTGVRYEGSAP